MITFAPDDLDHVDTPELVRQFCRDHGPVEVPTYMAPSQAIGAYVLCGQTGKCVFVHGIPPEQVRQIDRAHGLNQQTRNKLEARRHAALMAELGGMR